MTEPVLPKLKKTPNPLYGLKLDKLLADISECYGWERLAEVLNIERFQYHTGMKSTMKFLRNHEWAKEKVENCYLYMYKHYPWPDDKQLMIPPRDRSTLGEPLSDSPAEIDGRTNINIEHASDMRNLQNKHKNSKGNKMNSEPAYDPTNPWNK